MNKLIRDVYEEEYYLTSIVSDFYSVKVRDSYKELLGDEFYKNHPVYRCYWNISYVEKYVSSKSAFKETEEIAEISNTVNALIGDTIKIGEKCFLIINKIYTKEGDIYYQTEPRTIFINDKQDMEDKCEMINKEVIEFIEDEKLNELNRKIAEKYHNRKWYKKLFNLK